MVIAADLGALEARIYEDIAPARHMGVRVLAYDAQGLRLAAPLAANSNHKGTAFGGSLYCVAVLAGWALLALELQARGIDAQIVIQESAVDYRIPVTADFAARAILPGGDLLERCVRMLARYRRARIDVVVLIESDGVEAVRMRGTYVMEMTGSRG